jgi:predicted RecA/RadA family phage recombinase
MATPRFNGPCTSKPFIAAEALEPYRLVLISTNNEQCEYPAAQFDGCFGVTLHAAAAGEMVDVAFDGIALLQVDGAAANIVAFDSIVAHNDVGLGQKAAGGAAGLRKCIAVALSASTADNDVIPVRLSPHTAYFAS